MCIKRHSAIKVRIISGLFALLAFNYGVAQAAATFNESSGVLFVPAVDVDRGAGAYSVTLQLAGTPSVPKNGDEFVVQGAIPNAALGLRNVSYTSSNGLAYFPEILFTTSQGTFNYRMMLQYIPESNPFRLKVLSLAQNAAAAYEPTTGELHIPMVNINHGLQSYDVLLKRTDAKTGLFEEGHEFAAIGVTNAPQGFFDSAYDGSTDSGYVGQVLISDNGRVLNYRIRLQGIPIQDREIWRGKVVSMALNGSDGIAGPQGLKGDKGDAGLQGLKGDKGDAGLQGLKGDKGDAGLQGLDANTILSGSGTPAVTLGKNGDFYIDATTKSVYGPKINGLWGVAATLTGPKGDKGDTGPQGPAGSSGGGSTGAQGPAGPQGATGQGVPIGGTAGQVLSKIDSTNYNTQWTTLATGGDMQKSIYDTDNNSKIDKDKVAADLAISGGTVDNSAIGATTASSGKFTTLQVTGGIPGTGKVLTSDASGNATWAAAGWGLTGNASGAANFIGTTDNANPLIFKVNSVQALRIEPRGSPNLIGGYFGNNVTAGLEGATIGGGGVSGLVNKVEVNYGTVAGGIGNTATGTIAGVQYSTVSGGRGNTASHDAATVAGGRFNNAISQDSTVAGGNSNTAGSINPGEGTYSTVAGGLNNKASGMGSTVAGGGSNTASGLYSTVAGGKQNIAAGDYSFAAGRLAKIIDPLHAGSFLFADSTNADFNSVAANEFAVRATGGVRLVTAVDGTGAPTAGVTLAAGGSAWNVISDRAKKENFAPVDNKEVLEKVAALPIETWNYKTQDDSIRHIGPMAQDFRAAFGLGEDEKTISTVDPDGVALAAIQGLYKLVKDQQAEIAELKKHNQQVTERLQQVEARFMQAGK